MKEMMMPPQYREIPRTVRQQFQGRRLPLPLDEIDRIPLSDRRLRMLQVKQFGEVLKSDLSTLPVIFNYFLLQLNAIAKGYISPFDFDFDPDVAQLAPELEEKQFVERLRFWHVNHEISLRRAIRTAQK